MPKITPTQSVSLSHTTPIESIDNQQPPSNEVTIEPPHSNISTTITNPASVVNIEFARKLHEFKKIIEELYILERLQELAGWDRDTYMPKVAIQGRKEAIDIAERMFHEKLTSRKMGGLIDFLQLEENYSRLSTVEKALLRKVKYTYERDKNKPTSLAEKLKETESTGRVAYTEAHDKNDFIMLMPFLKKIIALKQKEAKCIGYRDSPYDALLQDWEPGLNTKQLDQIFSELKKELIPIARAIKRSKVQINRKFLDRSVSEKKLQRVANELLKHIGFDFEKGRLDESSNPFCSAIGANDIRITTDYKESPLLSLIGYVLHEGGHGIYAQNYAPEVDNTWIADSSSFGMDEGIARLYETIIGMGEPFWIYYYPWLQDRLSGTLNDISLDEFYKAINTVDLSSDILDDEISCALNLAMIYEIEKDLIEGNLEVKNIPEIWKQKRMAYIGETPQDVNKQLLKDDHWYTNYFGYFPTYILGRLYAAQIYNTAKKEIQNLEIKIASGDMKTLKEWLTEKIFKYGRTRSTEEIIKEVTGEGLNPKYFIQHIKEKYGKMYPEVAKLAH